MSNPDGFTTLTNADFSQTNLTNAAFIGAKLTGANLTQANLTNADFLYTPTLASANLSQANLTNADFSGTSYPIYDENGQYIGDGISPGADLSNAILSAVDARGANFQYATLSGANTSNLIQSDGHISGLNLTSGASLVVRD